MIESLGLEGCGSFLPPTPVAQEINFRSLRDHQNHEWAHAAVTKGIGYAKSGQFEKAIAIYLDALSVDPDHKDAYVALGAAYANTSQFEKALENFQAARDLDPDDVNAQKYYQATELRKQQIDMEKTKEFERKKEKQLEKEISIEEGEAKAKEYDIMFTETSAKAGFNIKALFRKVASALPGIDKLSIGKEQEFPEVILSPENNNKPAAGEEVAVFEKNKGLVQKYNAYRKAVQSIKAHPTAIKSGKEAKMLDGVGAKIALKVDEILGSGKLKKLDKLRANSVLVAVNEVSKVSGIGPAKAKELIDQGIKTIEDLKKVKTLNHHQKIGLKYFDDFEERVPRAEIEKLEAIVKNALLKIDKNIIAETCVAVDY
eukprot:gene6382-7394_t